MDAPVEAASSEFGASTQNDVPQPQTSFWTRSNGENLETSTEWRPLEEVNKALLDGYIQTWKQALFARAIAARNGLDAAIDRLEFSYINLASISTSSTPDGIQDLLSSLDSAREAGLALFAPQAAYQAAIKNLRRFIVDLLTIQHDTSDMHMKRVAAEVAFWNFVHTSEHFEENIKKSMMSFSELFTSREKRGGEGAATAKYLACVRKRFHNLRQEQHALRNWVELFISDMREIRERSGPVPSAN